MAIMIPRGAMRGVVHLHSETGTEGGDWAFQDACHIRKLEDHELTYFCTKCGLWSGAGPNGPRIVNGSFGRLPEVCKTEDHAFDQVVTREAWSYEGLHILGNDDRLIILDRRKRRMLWDGSIDLIMYPVFTESANGMWIHADQRGMPRKKWAKWFFGRQPAILVKRNKRRLQRKTALSTK